MKTIVQTKFGSSLYGTAVETSDVDLMAVHLPTAKEILLQRCKEADVHNTKKDESVKNSADDVDSTSFVLHKFLNLVAQGQAVALDILFSTPENWVSVEPLWLEICKNKQYLLSKESKSFIGYSRVQANKYCLRGSRMSAARNVMSILDNLLENNPNYKKLGEWQEFLEEKLHNQEFVEFVDRENPGNVVIRHLSVCNRLLPYTHSIKEAHGVVKKLLDNYGHRSLAAESAQGVDWKAVYHSIRVAYQGIEFFETGNITFPRPERELLISVRKGLVPYAQVSEKIEELLVQLEQVAAKSSLPEQADFEWIDNFVCETYNRVIQENF